MPDPWFDASRYGWIFGTCLGVFGGTLGGMAGQFAAKGKYRAQILGCYYALLAIVGLLFVAGLVAWLSGQPYGVWGGLGMPGLLGLVIFVPLLRVVLHQYRQAELRRSKSHDL